MPTADKEPDFRPVMPMPIPVMPAVSSAPEAAATSDAPAAKPPIIPSFAIPTMPSAAGVNLPPAFTPPVFEPQVVAEPAPVVDVVSVVEVVEPEPVVDAAPAYVDPTPAYVAPPPVVEPVPAPAPAPVYVAPPPVAAPTYVAPQAVAPAYTPPPAPAPIAAAPVSGRQALDVQIDMFQTGPGEMTMRAATTNAPAAGYPHIALEMALQMNAMRGMRAITPSNSGDPNQPRIALETVSTEAPEAARMRLLVGSQHEPALDAVLRTGESIAVRTGNGPDQPLIRLDLNPTPEGGSVLRATLLPARGGAELTLEMRRDPVNDGFTDARWRNRLSLFA